MDFTQMLQKTRSVSACLCLCAVAFGLAAPALAGTDISESVRRRDVIYGRKHGTALTLDVFTPKNANGIGVLWIVNAGGRSNVERIDGPSCQKCVRVLLSTGYTVFTVVHSSAPRFNLQDMAADVRRAVRFVRYRASDFHIDAQHLGIAGASAGGTLALLMGTTGHTGDPNHPDPVERVSSKVHAVGCFFAPSDWLDFDGQGTDVLTFQKTKYGAVDPSFIFFDTDPKQQTWSQITDQQKIRLLLREYSPVAQVTKDDAATLIIHGDADPFIPLQQSERLIHRLEENAVPCRLLVKPAQGHGWSGWEDDTAVIADWFDTHLRQKDRQER